MNITPRVLPFLAALVLIAGCGGEGGDTTTAPSTPPDTTATSGTATGTTTGAGGGAPTLTEVASGFDSPTQVVPVPGTDGEIWVLERRGTIRRVVDHKVAPDPVLDISSRVKSGGEQGLLSLAFSPTYEKDRLVYIHNSDPDGNTLVAEYRASSAGQIDPEPVRVLLTEDQPYANHNGGSLAFGPDGKLYLGLGDGGDGYDPEGRSQDMGSRLGKLLRTEIGADTSNGSWEIAALGLRNPWRFAFDPDTGDAWIADVGQNRWEEVDVFPKGADLLNFGWAAKEGTHDVEADKASELNPRGTLTPPVAEYSHDEGCSITGGVVVRNPAMASLNGRYIYTDFCSGTFWSIPVDGARTPRREPFTARQPVSVDAGSDGRVYVTSIDGTVQELAAR